MNKNLEGVTDAELVRIQQEIFNEFSYVLEDEQTNTETLWN